MGTNLRLLAFIYIVSVSVSGRVQAGPIDTTTDGSLIITTTELPNELFEDAAVAEQETTVSPIVDLATPEEKDDTAASRLKSSKNDAAMKPEIRSFRIQSNIRYRYSRTYVTSRVANPSNNGSQEVTFTVVLPETAFISKFIMEIDGKTYEAYVKPKEEAKNIYNQAQSQGQSAGLVELNTRNSNIFNVNVNIKAQSKVNFNLTYEELLSRRLGRYEQSVSITPEQVKDIQAFEVNVDIEESQPITLLRVPELRNDIEENGNTEGNMKDAVIKRNGTKASVTWKPAAKDLGSLSEQGVTGKFIVQYDIERELNAGQVLVNNGYFVHFFAPTDLPPLRKHVVFILDISGSMWGRKIEQLKEAMTKILADLNSDDYFNIITFSSDVSLWGPEDKAQQDPTNSWAPPPYLGENTVAKIANDASKKQPFPANAENIKKAQNYINALVATGGTNIHDAIVTGLNLTSLIRQSSAATRNVSEPIATSNTTQNSTQVNTLPKGVESIVLFLTDGEPTVGVTNPATIQTLIQTANKNLSVPIFSLAFGEGADFPFVKKLSLQNNGFARKIYEASDATLQLTGFYNEIASPLLSNVTFNYTSPDFEVTNVTVTKFPTIFGGTEIAVAGVLVPTNSTNGTSSNGTAILADDAIFDDEATTRLPRLEDSVALPNADAPAEGLVRTDMYDLNVKVGGVGRDGALEFTNPEIFSCPIPWGVPPIVRPFPPRPTPPPAPEDTFLEKLWAYLTIRQLIDQDLAVIEKENEIDMDTGDVTEASTTSTTASTVAKNQTVKETAKQRALRLALKYGFVTPLTSLVVVKPNDTQVTDAVPSDAKPEMLDSVSSPQAMAHYLVRAPPSKKSPFAGAPGFSNAFVPLSLQAHRPIAAASPIFAFANNGPPGAAFGPPMPSFIGAPDSSGLSNHGGFAHYQPLNKLGVGHPGAGIQPSRPIPIYATLATPLPPSISSSSSPAAAQGFGPVDYEEDSSAATSATPVLTSAATTKAPVSTTPAAPVPTTAAESAPLGLKDIKWFSNGATEIRLNGTSVYKIAVNETAEDLKDFISGSPCEISTSKAQGTCVHVRDCVQREFVDDYDAFKTAYFCGIESATPNQVPYAGVCCPAKVA